MFIIYVILIFFAYFDVYINAVAPLNWNLYALKFIEKHKALLISSLISGTLLLGLFSMHLTKKGLLASESYYEIQPEKTPEELLKEEIAMNEQSTSSTNKAYNETDEFKDLMKNFKTVSSKDFEENSKLTETENTETEVEDALISSAASAIISRFPALFSSIWLEVNRALVASDPKNIFARRNLSIDLDKLGDVALRQGDPQKALEYYHECFEIRSVLLAADKTDIRLQRDLSSVHTH